MEQTQPRATSSNRSAGIATTIVHCAQLAQENIALAPPSLIKAACSVSQELQSVMPASFIAHATRPPFAFHFCRGHQNRALGRKPTFRTPFETFPRTILDSASLGTPTPTIYMSRGANANPIHPSSFRRVAPSRSEVDKTPAALLRHFAGEGCAGEEEGVNLPRAAPFSSEATPPAENNAPQVTSATTDAEKAARKAAKKRAKAERRAKREGRADPERGQKCCGVCGSLVDLLIRCVIDESGAWKMVCGKCWKSVSGGVVDGDEAHPHYRYGGLWKNHHRAKG